MIALLWFFQVFEPKNIKKRFPKCKKPSQTIEKPWFFKDFCVCSFYLIFHVPLNSKHDFCQFVVKIHIFWCKSASKVINRDPRGRSAGFWKLVRSSCGQPWESHGSHWDASGYSTAPTGSHFLQFGGSQNVIFDNFPRFYQAKLLITKKNHKFYLHKSHTGCLLCT